MEFAFTPGQEGFRKRAVRQVLALLYGMSLRVRGGAALEPPAAAPRRGLAKPARALRPGRPAAHAARELR
jgi:hypothetical protein